MQSWVWQDTNWPQFTWDEGTLSQQLLLSRGLQGKLLGMVHVITDDSVFELNLSALTSEAVDTSAIEGELLNRNSVRSSIANRLGLNQAGIQVSSDRYIEGLLDMLFDATNNYSEPLTLQRLFGWHAALFPTGYSGIQKITVGAIRDTDQMRIISGRPGKEKTHYQAPPAELAKKGIKQLLKWFNQSSDCDGLLRAGMAHLWFEMLHPFDDGNGRVGRAIIDYALSQDEQLNTRYYSLSSVIMHDRKNYYSQLEAACRGGMDITPWLSWFLECFQQAIDKALTLIEEITLKSQFWQRHAKTPLNPKQIKVLNKLLDYGPEGYIGSMTTRKYMGITRTSRATAYRELIDLVNKNCIKPTADKGRSAAYEIVWPKGV
ncbi:MAG: Fic family protein [Coxiellaceae bacterium]|nr:Fic family protein [Coxiellaceae bacterium]